MFDILEKKILNREARIGVVGVGYVGLPTATIFATAGYSVIGIDTDEKKVDALNRGECYVKEPGLEPLVRAAVRGRRLSGTTSHSLLSDCDIIIFCTQTPLNRNGHADLGPLMSAIKMSVPHTKVGVLVICESTVPVGTTRMIAGLFTESGMHQLDRDLWVAHCPERVLPGRVIHELRDNTRIVGGLTEMSTRLAKSLFMAILPAEKIKTCTSEVSEFAKLAENTYRDVNIALANEFAMIADALGVDVVEAIRIANFHPRVNIHSPGIGVGGHCLPKDSLLLFDSVRRKGVRPEVILRARQVNKAMPKYNLDRLEGSLSSRSFKGQRVLILGTSFKENVDDPRNSPAAVLIEDLLARGALVRAHDPLCAERFGAESVTSLEEGVRWADIIILTAAHSDYLKQLPSLDMSEKIFYDGRNAFSASTIRCKCYIGVGRPMVT